MRREFTFRAYDKLFKKFIYGIETTKPTHVTNEGGSSGYFTNDFGDYLSDPDRFVVQQFTGTRLHGVKVYEGDVIRTTEAEDGETFNEFYEVRWSKEQSGFVAYNRKFRDEEPIGAFDGDPCAVVHGTIFDKQFAEATK